METVGASPAVLFPDSQFARLSESIFFNDIEISRLCVVSASFGLSRLLKSIKLRSSAQASAASDSGRIVVLPFVSATSAPVGSPVNSQFKVELEERKLSKSVGQRPTGWRS